MGLDYRDGPLFADRVEAGAQLGARAVAHHQPVPDFVTLASERRSVNLDLGQTASASIRRAHSRTISSINDEDTQRDATGALIVASRLGDYGEHGSYLPDQRCHAGLA